MHIDGHSDFRHPGNSDECASLAGEDLAAAAGLHWPAISNIDDAGPYFDPRHIAHIGCRDDDAQLAEVRSVIGATFPSSDWRRRGATAIAEGAKSTADSRGYWLQIDVDVLDPAVMPAVDSPDPGGCTPDELVELLNLLAPRAVGASVTVFDPDLDPDGRHARHLTDMLVDGLPALGTGLRQ